MDPEENRLKRYAGQACILIVDDNANLCAIVQQAFLNFEIEARIVTNPLDVIDLMRDNFYNLVFLDNMMPEKSGIDLIPEITETSPDSKVIVMTGYADKETAINALRWGAFDFLEKPVEFKLLFHSAFRALETQRIQLENIRTLKELKLSRDELLDQKAKLEYTNKKLFDTNNALSVLAENIERARTDEQVKMVVSIRSNLLPVLERLERDRGISSKDPDWAALMDFVEDLTAGLTGEAGISTSLSATELRVASLIKSGLKTDEIAEHLFVSANTVKTHRRSIRRKLRLSNSSSNLRTYLKTRLGEGDDLVDMGD